MDYEKVARELADWLEENVGAFLFPHGVDLLAARLREIVPENGVDVEGLADAILKDIDDAWELEDEVEHKTLCRTISRHLSDASERIKELEAERDYLSRKLMNQDRIDLLRHNKLLREVVEIAYAFRTGNKPGPSFAEFAKVIDQYMEGIGRIGSAKAALAPNSVEGKQG